MEATSTELSWAKADTHYKRENVYMASIHSDEEENLFIYNLFGGDYYFWIGGNDLEFEDKWTWSDGSTWNFTSWSNLVGGQPDNANKLS